MQKQFLLEDMEFLHLLYLYKKNCQENVCQNEATVLGMKVFLLLPVAGCVSYGTTCKEKFVYTLNLNFHDSTLPGNTGLLVDVFFYEISEVF